MKTLTAIVGLLICFESVLVSQGFFPLPVKPPPTPEEITQSYLTAQLFFYNPRDPWRRIDGQVRYAKGSDWVQFVGKVLQSTRDGIRVQGYYGPPMILPNEIKSKVLVKADEKTTLIVPQDVTFFVKGFPYEMADGEYISWPSKFVALDDGGFDQSSGRKIHRLTYGLVTTEPAPRALTEEEKQALADKAAQKKAEADLKALEWHKKLAADGDVYGMFRMGERYWTGNGVPEDKTKGRELLNKAADVGSLDAKMLLEKISAPQMEVTK